MKIQILPCKSWLKTLDANTVKSDIVAGITGAFLVIPQGIAYALIAGLPPEFGLYAAIVSAILASLFGSSLHMVSGPTAALSIVSAVVISNVLGSSHSSYLSLMFLLTFLVGMFQLGFAFLRLGSLANFISHSVIQGFTSGAAVLIAASQLSHLFGLSGQTGGGMVSKIGYVIMHWQESNGYALLVGLVTIGSAVLFRRYLRAVPFLLSSMIFSSLFCLISFDVVANNITMISALPTNTSFMALPPFDWNLVTLLASGALTIAILGSIEAISIARSIAMRSKQRIDTNQELFGQGISNVVGSFFQCYPSSGSFTRSGGNYDSGAKTPLAIVFSAGLVLLVLLFAPNVTKFIPVPVMAGSIIVIAWNLFGLKGFRQMMKAPKAESLPFITTFISTLVFPLEYAIYIGMGVSLALYLARTSRPRLTIVAPYQDETGLRQIKNIARYQLAECPAIKIVRLDGSIFFGASEYFQQSLQSIVFSHSQNLIVVCKGVNFVDASGQYAMYEEIERITSSGGRVFFSSLKGNTLDEFTDQALLERFSEGVLKASTQEAITEMVKSVPSATCRACPKHVFLDCPSFTPDQ